MSCPVSNIILLQPIRRLGKDRVSGGLVDVDLFPLERPHEALTTGIVIGVGRPAHARKHVGLSQEGHVCLGGVTGSELRCSPDGTRAVQDRGTGVVLLVERWWKASYRRCCQREETRREGMTSWVPNKRRPALVWYTGKYSEQQHDENKPSNHPVLAL